MPEPVLSVCWKDHINELSSVYKGLLKNNFLVDCTLSAEGQSLKAHRLVLSACSPYFQTLFHEETEKHAFVVLLHAPFETLKAIIEFMYQGEVQIPEGNLESFLTVAQSLQIKGLNGFTRNYKNKNLSGSGTASISRSPLQDYHNTSINQSIHVDKGSPENTCQQRPRHTDGHTNVHSDSSVLFESCNASHEEVQTVSVASPLQEHQRPVECNEVSFETEISVKHEPLYAVFSETNVPENIKSSEPTATSEINVGSDVFHKQNLNQYSSCTESSLGNVESSELPPSHLSGEMDSERIILNQHEHLLPVMLVPKSEHVEDAGSGEPMDDQDMSGNDTNEGTESASFEENLDQCSNFRRKLTMAPIANENTSKENNGQASSSSSSSTTNSAMPMVNKRRRGQFSVSVNIRKQNVGAHWLLFVSQRGRCELCSMKKIQSRPHSKCSVCQVFLCCNEKKNCFTEYHHI